jgi:glycosyltransferase involved in cell wall biosynthesis
VTPLVTVIVPAYNRRAGLVAALDALAAQSLDPALVEVIVVDNASDDGTSDAVRSWQGPIAIRLLRIEVNRGPAQARNLGLAEAHGEFVAFTDSDCEPAPGWLEVGLAAFEPGVGVVQGATLPGPPGAAATWEHTQNITAFTKRYESCNVFYRTDALRKAGGFDEHLGYFCEDIAAGWSILRLGLQPAFAEGAIVHHEVAPAGLRWYLRRTRHYRNWPRVVRAFPEIRGGLLWQRFFLEPHTAAFAVAAIGGALAVRWRPALLLSLPYLWIRGPRSPRPAALRAKLELALFDASVFAAMVEGSLAARTLVL